MSLPREEIIRMARACGALELHSSEYAITGDSAIERFANAAYAAGAAAEREAALSRYVPVALVSEEFGSDTHYIETIDKKMRIPEGTKLFMEVQE